MKTIAWGLDSHCPRCNEVICIRVPAGLYVIRVCCTHCGREYTHIVQEYMEVDADTLRGEQVWRNGLSPWLSVIIGITFIAWGIVLGNHAAFDH